VPTAGSLADGELAINLTDEKLYFKNAAGVVKLLSASSGASGTVTSVDVSGGTTGLSFSGGPITTSGTITMAGTLGVANGGTGASTLSSGYLLKGNGTSAVSASVVYDNGTNVGIGTASPGYLLQVGSRVSVGSDGVIQWGQALTGSNRGILSWDTNIASVNAATNLVLASNGTTERMRITTAGDVGIGTSAPGTKLHVFAGVATITSPTVNATSYATREDGLYFTRNDIPTTWRNKISNSWSADPSFTTMNFELATGSATNNTVMSLFANGSVGIGTVTPSAKLDVNGTGYFSDNVSIVRNNTAGSLSGLTINNPGTTAAYAGINISSGTVTSQLFNDAAGNAVVAGAVLRTTTNHPFVFGTNATERMRIDVNGNLLVGTTVTNGRLSVVGDQISIAGGGGSGQLGLQIKGIALNAIPAAQVQGYIATGDSTIGVAGDLLIAPRTDVTASVRFITGTTPAERMRISSIGDVGIGTSSPGVRLHVVASASQTAAIIESTSTSAFIGLRNSGSTAYIGADNTGAFIVQTPGSSFSTKMLVSSTGDVGIGTNSPGARLHVVGGNIAVDADSRRIGYITDGTAANTGYMIPYDGSGFLSLHSNFSSGGIKFHTGTSNVERMRITAAGNVGIGASSPSSKLTVLDGDIEIGATGLGNTLLSFNGTIANITVNSSSAPLAFGTNSAERMRITSAGDVGVGTSTPGYKLEARTDNATASNWITSFNNTATGPYGAGFIARAVSNFGYFYIRGDGVAYVENAGNNPLGLATNGIERMRVTGGGNVGIGTSAPGARLDLGAYTGPALATSMLKMQDGWHDIITSAAVVGSRYYYGAGIYGRFYADVNGFNIDTSSTSGPIIFGTAGSERMRITAAGFVGINTLSPSALLHVQAGDALIKSSSDGSNGILRIQNTAGTTTVQSYADNNDGWLGVVEVKRMSFVTGNIRRMCIDTAGNVGIGTASPTAMLTVNGTAKVGEGVASNTSKFMVNTLSGTAAGIQLIQDANESWIIQNPASTNVLTFSNSGTERMRITAAGLVGIGTSAPIARLDLGTPGNTTFLYATNGVDSTFGVSFATNATTITNLGGSAAIAFATGAAERMRITDTGNVGVATAAPIGRFAVQASQQVGFNGAVSGSPQAGNLFYGTDNTGWKFDIGKLVSGTFTAQMTFQDNGNVGVGTTSPAVRFVISNAGANGFEFNTADNIFQTYNRATSAYTDMLLYALQHRFFAGTSPTERMRIDSSGNVMVGTTAANNKFLVTYANPVSVPAAGAGGHCTAFGTVGYGLATGALTNGNAYLQVTRWDATATNYDLLLQPNGGNVGIGTTAPGAKLTLTGASELLRLANATPFLSFYNAAQSARFGYIQHTGTALALVNEQAGQMEFYTNSAERMRIEAAGNVVVGTTGQTARGNLDISLGNNATAGIERSLHFGYSAADFYGFKLSNINSPGSFGAGTFSIQRGTTAAWVDAVLINDVGNVGIGTTSPESPFQVLARFRVQSDGVVRWGSDVRAGLFNESGYLTWNTGRVAVGYQGIGAVTFETSGQERVRIDSSGNVGIGTSSPGAPLDVVGTTRSGNFRVNSGGNVTGGGMWGNDTNLAFNTGSTERVRIDSSGNVGVGTATPNNRLQSAYSVPASVPASGAGAHGLAVGSANFGLAAGALSNGNGYLQATRWDGTAGNYDLLLQPNGGNVGVGTIGAGNVGIGTTAPVTKLDVSGNHSNTRARLYSTGGDGTSGFGPSILSLWASEPGVSYTGAGIGGNISGSVGQGRVDSTNGQSYIRFMPADIVFGTSATDAVERMRIDSSGNVGIATSSPTGTLQVAGTSAFSWSGGGATSALAVIGTQGTAGGSLFVHTASLNSSFASGLAIDGTYSSPLSTINIKAVGVRSGGGYGSNISFQTSNENTLAEHMRITNTGNVGIGTTSPSLKFVVSNGGAAGLEIDPTALASAPIIQSYNRSGAAYTQLGYNALQHIWQVSGSEGMRIDSSGNLGIGTSSPGARLHILGAQRIEHVGDRVIDFVRSSANTFSIEHDTARMYFYNVTTAATVLAFDNASNVGMGTANPSAKLEVNNGASACQVRIRGGTSGSSAPELMLYGNSSDHNWTIQGNHSAALQFFKGTFGSLGSELMRLSISGGFSVGTTTDAGAGSILASGNVTAYSDIRVKDNIEQIDGALDRVQRIRGVTYTRTDREDTERRFAGVIAQEIEQVLPEAVFDSGDLKAVDYNATIGLLIEAIKELTARVAELEGK
jgi:hypothetical protein